jgi:WhiB family transcriptional regulator, redox-sensing transcriptional regulator
MVATGNWRVSANCRNGDPERLFVTGAKQRDARSVCRGCPVLTQCLSHALDERIEFGVWGGMTERDRRAMLRNRPDVTCWESFLEDVAARRSAAAAPVPTPAVAPVRVPVLLPIPLVPAAARQAQLAPATRSDRLSEAA